jgi:hypothetical protein
VNQSPTIGALAAALAKAQGEIKGALKDSTNPFFKSKYADLSSVKDACQEALTKYGVAVIQSPSAEGSKVSVTTVLCHESNEWVSGVLTATAKDESAQSVGSAITYLRRYALASMVGVTAEDDDGESAQPRPATPAQRIVAAAAKVDDKQALLRAQRIKLLIARHGEGFRSFCKDTLGREVSSGKDLTDADIDRLEASADDVE